MHVSRYLVEAPVVLMFNFWKCLRFSIFLLENLSDVFIFCCLSGLAGEVMWYWNSKHALVIYWYTGNPETCQRTTKEYESSIWVNRKWEVYLVGLETWLQKKWSTKKMKELTRACLQKRLDRSEKAWSRRASRCFILHHVLQEGLQRAVWLLNCLAGLWYFAYTV